MTIRWGIAGPGDIATRFAEGMALVDGGTIAAVASRSRERAETFGDRFGIPRRYDSYAALADDPDVDVVYVATPPSRHAADCLLYLQGDKHVLCEKPFTLSAAQGQTVADLARARGLFLMEAMWTRFLPAYRRLVELIGEGRIGEPLLVEAEFGFRMPVMPTHRLFDLSQGGGALLDLGIYPVQLCSLVLGTPDRVVAAGNIGETGVDELVAAVLHHSGGQLGLVKAALRVDLPCRASIAGTEGSIAIPPWHHCPDHLTLKRGPEVERIDVSWEGEGLRFQVEEVHRCLLAGETFSPVMPVDETLSIAATLDAIRDQIGLRYPGEMTGAAVPPSRSAAWQP